MDLRAHTNTIFPSQNQLFSAAKASSLVDVATATSTRASAFSHENNLVFEKEIVSA